MPDEVARIGALSNGSNGQRSLESASLHFEALWRRERGEAEQEPAGEILKRGFCAKELSSICRFASVTLSLSKAQTAAGAPHAKS
jgi:hypothetical protein